MAVVCEILLFWRCQADKVIIRLTFD